MHGEQAPELEVHYQRGDGARIWTRIMGRAVHNTNGDVVGGVVALVDVDAQRSAEEALRQANRELEVRIEARTAELRANTELFENAFQYAAIGMALVGVEGAFLKVNRGLCDIVGYSEPELLSKSFQSITHPEDLHADLELLNQLVKGVIPSYRLSKRYIRKDGAEVWIRLAVSMVAHLDGSPRHFVAQVEDLSAARAAERKLRESEVQYRLIAENTTDIILTSDTSGRATFVSPSCFETTGYAPDEIVGTTLASFVDRDDLDRVRRNTAAVVRGQPSARVRWRMRHKLTGNTVWLESQPALLHDPESRRPSGFLDVMRPVTEQVAQEGVVADARAAAERANEAKSNFLAVMSHEIRTPLNGVLGMAQAMSADDLSERQRERLDVIRQSGESLLAILNDVLDLSKIESGRLLLEEGEFSLEDLARGAHATFTALANKKGLSFDLAVEPVARGFYAGDSTRVRQILYNLISNALKFTERGQVRVVASRSESSLIIEVCDTGVGIAPDRLNALFQKFEQEDASTTRRFGGTGLGLAISRELAELMGGHISVQSALGQGSTFRVDLPLVHLGDRRPASVAIDRLDERLPPPEGPERKLRVLAAEDNTVNQLVLKTLLHQIGVEPVVVGDGEQALTAWRDGVWDLILMDIQMPLRDGLSAVAEIRRLEAESGRPRTPVIALTANAMTHQVEQYAAAGMDGFVAKPVEVSKLYAAMELALAAPHEPVVAGVSPS
jgi:PAS domain S-box-containing protein